MATLAQLPQPAADLSKPTETRPPSALPQTVGKRKAAVLLATLDDELTASVLRQLSEEEIHEVTRELSLLTRVTEDERTAIMNEFLETADGSRIPTRGGLDYATSILMSTFGPETGKRMAERLMKSLGNEMPSLDTLRKTDPQQLAKVIYLEHPQTIALVLSHLGSSNAARVLGGLPQDVRIQVVRRMALLDQVSPEMTDRLARSICAKLRVVGDTNMESFGGVRAVAEILNQLGGSEADEILEKLSSADETLAGNVRNFMFVFEDLVNISAQSMRKLQSAVDKKLLTLALKGTTPEVKKHFLSVMSQRASEMLQEDMDSLGPVLVRDVMDAQQQIIAIARRLQAEGAINLQAGANDAYVT